MVDSTDGKYQQYMFPKKIDGELCRWKLQRRILPNCLGSSNSR